MVAIEKCAVRAALADRRDQEKREQLGMSVIQNFAIVVLMEKERKTFFPREMKDSRLGKTLSRVRR